MQTFLLSRDHKITAKILDYKRLGKQRLECTQLMDVLLRKAGLLDDGKKGWANHVAIDYWHSSEGNWLPSLINYTQVMIDEWVKRGYNNTIDLSKYKKFVWDNNDMFKLACPPWQSKAEAVINSHRARVLQKDEAFYAAKFIEFGIPIPENWQEIEYTWMRPTVEQAKALAKANK